MTPAFTIPETGEMVLIKPNGRMEFYPNDPKKSPMVNSITFEDERSALIYARNRRWKEVQTV